MAARSAAVVFALALALALALAAGASAQQVPGILQCAQSAEQVGEDNLLIRLAPCASGTNAACCESASGLLQLGGGGELAGCPCAQLFFNTMLDRVANNPLAKSFSVTRESVMNILTSCGIKYAGGEGDNACPASGGLLGLKHGGGLDKHGAMSAATDDNSNDNKHGGDWGKHGRRLFA
jgi:hypothetical protein